MAGSLAHADDYDTDALIGEWLQVGNRDWFQEDSYEYLRIHPSLEAVLVTDLLGEWEQIKILRLKPIKLPSDAGFTAWEWRSQETPLRMRLVLSAWRHEDANESAGLATGSVHLYEAKDGKLILFNTIHRRFQAINKAPSGINEEFARALSEISP